ncbi:MAG: glycosyltransferase family 2 protein [Chitinophagaceae bacterium]|nr:glycosyltransferase family 2 protein [Chitinophagaceae bacterium]
MKVTGFSFIKNAVKFDFPIKESLLSILPLCDEIVVTVGDCTDGTRELVASIHPTKIKIVDTIWNEQLQSGGAVLADETNKAFQSIDKNTDWCFYIQGDEVIHEQDYDIIKNAMFKYKDDDKVDGLLFKYYHFYGSYDYIGASNKWYRNEIRIIKNNKSIYSYKDAQGFRKGNDEKLSVKEIDAHMFHYGWVKDPSTMMAKRKEGVKFWEGHKYTEEYDKTDLGDYDFSSIDALEKFKGSHPKVMKERIEKMNWKFNYDVSFNNYSLKDKFKNLLFTLTGRRFFEYQNYKKI